MRVILLQLFVVLPIFARGQIFTGGSGSGFSADATINTNLAYFVGGESDGFSSSELINNNLGNYVGGSGDGSDHKELIINVSDRFIGGVADGFAFVHFDFIANPSSSCTFVQNEWVGANGFWADPSNWSALMVPDACHDVTINAADVVTISNGEDALAKTLSLAGVLNINNGSSLSLDGRDTVGSIVQIAGGTLINDGLLAIENFTSGSISRSGIRISSNGELINSNSISIDSIGENTSYGMQIANGIFRNLAQGELYIQNGALATGYGIRNSDSLVTDGTLTISNFQGLGAILNQAYLKNSGLINAYDIRGGILNQDSIFNSGHIFVENATEFHGLRNSRVDSYYENALNSLLEINSASDSYSVESIGAINNKGVFRITDTPAIGIFSNGGQITNSGTIYCEFYNGVGFRAIGGTIANNGLLEIRDLSNGSFDGIDNQQGSIITNSGMIRIYK